MNIKNTKKFVAAISIVAGILGNGTVQAGYIYELNATDGDGLPDFTLRVPALISSDLVLGLSDFESITLPPTPTVTSVSLRNFLSNPNVEFNTSTGSFGFFWTSANAFTGPGQYCAGFIGCSNTAAIMTISQTADTPEPATLALMGLGLAGMGWKTRRKAAV